MSPILKFKRQPYIFIYKDTINTMKNLYYQYAMCNGNFLISETVILWSTYYSTVLDVDFFFLLFF